MVTVIIFHTVCLPCFLARFNKNPKKGVKYLQDNGLLGPAPDDVSEFLHTDERLDKVILMTQSTPDNLNPSLTQTSH